jgi:hypothetical protein
MTGTTLEVLDNGALSGENASPYWFSQQIN